MIREELKNQMYVNIDRVMGKVKTLKTMATRPESTLEDFNRVIQEIEHLLNEQVKMISQ